MIYSLVAKRQEDVKPGEFATGVTRFDRSLRMVFPDLVSVTPEMTQGLLWTKDDIVITDNHLSLHVPVNIPTVVVHHGSAKSHYDRDPNWRSPITREMVQAQAYMFRLPNRTYVALSQWAKEQFRQYHGLPENYASVIVNWVPRIERERPADLPDRPVVLGDWRGTNKGEHIIPALRELCTALEFRPLRCHSEEERIKAYQEADVYLCLSLSEGSPYAVADAEAAALPITSTRVGNCEEFFRGIVTIEDRENPYQVIQSLGMALCGARLGYGSYYLSYSFEDWRHRWRQVVEKAKQGARPLL